ncbi:MAG: hypothetical protein H7833_01540 [Magnetococcus sp. DMHC-1]|nr:type II toxin-antitoxin system ParD family antitoxin [Magnetococcales bacterium]
MTTVETISIVLNQEMASVVRQSIADGEYASSDEVVLEALQEWMNKRSVRQQKFEEIRRQWQEGIESGPGQFVGMEDLLQEARRRFAAERNQE